MTPLTQSDLEEMSNLQLILIAHEIKLINVEEMERNKLIESILFHQKKMGSRGKDLLDKLSKIIKKRNIEFEDVWEKHPDKKVNKSTLLDLFKKVNDSENAELEISIDPGTSPKEEIASLLSDLSSLYKKMGGSGIVYKLDGVTINSEELV